MRPRRALNPRPPDYMSGALPSELPGPTSPLPAITCPGDCCLLLLYFSSLSSNRNLFGLGQRGIIQTSQAALNIQLKRPNSSIASSIMRYVLNIINKIVRTFHIIPVCWASRSCAGAITARCNEQGTWFFRNVLLKIS